MTLRTVVAESIQQVPLADWTRVCDPASDLLMNADFLSAAEAGMGVGTAGSQECGAETRFWYVLAYDGDNPVGAACVTEFPLDVLVFASPLARRVVGVVRKLMPNYLKFRITFCGLPISTAGSNLRVVHGADELAVVAALNQAVEQIACERKTMVIVYKELNCGEAEMLCPLLHAGYVQAESLPMNRIVKQHPNFDAMLDAMRSHYRYKIAKSRKKFAKSGLVMRRITGRNAIEAIYTPMLHSLYERVTLRAENRLELLPREYFLELAIRFPQDLVLTTISRGDSMLAFAWSISHGREYHNLFIGIDYDQDNDADVYFNLMVEDIAHGMSQPVAEILVGQTADDFKSRLGCTSDPRYLLIKVTNRLVRWSFRQWQASLLTPPPPPPVRDVFREFEPAVAADAIPSDAPVS